MYEFIIDVSPLHLLTYMSTYLPIYLYEFMIEWLTFVILF
jgi:hypothetical protein